MPHCWKSRVTTLNSIVYFRLKWFQTRTLVNQEVMHSLSMNMSVICIVSIIGLNFNIIRHWRHIHLSKLSHFIMNKYHKWNYWSKRCHFFHSGDFCLLLIAFVNSLDPGQDQWSVSTDLSVLIWIQTFWHSDSISESFFLLKNTSSFRWSYKVEYSIHLLSNFIK